MPEIDVVGLCYNGGRFLEACVRSLLARSVQDLRVHIIDDASSDNSFTIATKLAESDHISATAHPHNQGHRVRYSCHGPIRAADFSPSHSVKMYWSALAPYTENRRAA